MTNGFGIRCVLTLMDVCCLPGQGILLKYLVLSLKGLEKS